MFPIIGQLLLIIPDQLTALKGVCPEDLSQDRAHLSIRALTPFLTRFADAVTTSTSPACFPASLQPPVTPPDLRKPSGAQSAETQFPQL